MNQTAYSVNLHFSNPKNHYIKWLQYLSINIILVSYYFLTTLDLLIMLIAKTSFTSSDFNFLLKTEAFFWLAIQQLKISYNNNYFPFCIKENCPSQVTPTASQCQTLPRKEEIFFDYWMEIFFIPYLFGHKISNCSSGKNPLETLTLLNFYFFSRKRLFTWYHLAMDTNITTLGWPQKSQQTSTTNQLHQE